MAKGKKGGDKKEAAKPAAQAAPQPEEEGSPYSVRIATVAVTSYIAHKIWTKRSQVTEAWYADSQSEGEQAMVSVFDFASSMGLIFVVGIAVGVIFSKIGALVKRTSRS